MKAYFAPINPELQKNIWIGLSATKVWLLLAVHFLFYALVLVSGATQEATFKAYAAQSAALLLIFGVVVASRVTASMREELRDHTWDWLRLSSLTPTQIVLGKLFGAAAMWWIAIFVNAVIYVFTFQDLASLHSLSYHIAVYLGAVVTAAGCGTLLVNLINRGGLVLVIVLLGIVSTPISMLMGRANFQGLWWGCAVTQEQLAIWWFPLGALLSIWLAIRLVRRRMLIESLPIELLVLLMFTLIFSAGFFLPLENISLSVFAAAQLMFWMSLACSFLAAVMVPPSRPQVARLIGRIERSQWRRFCADLPGWAVPFICAVLSLCVCAATSSAAVGSLQFFPGIVLINLAALMFCLRDIAALHWRAFRVEAERRDLFIVVAYMALLYGLLPMFAHLLFNRENLFWPVGITQGQQLLSLASLGIQAGLVCLLTLQAWRSRD